MRFWSLLLLGTLAIALIGANEAQAAPTFQASGTAVGSTVSVSPAWPAHQVDDIALLFVESSGGQAVSLSVPAGFAAVLNSPQFTTPGGAATGTRITVFWARATSTAMPTPTVADPGNHVYAQILTYRGVVNTGDPWDVTGGGVKATASTSVSVTGVTTAVPDTLIVQAVARDNDSAAAAFSAQTNPNLTNITERSDGGTTAGNGGGIGIWDGVKATAGATGDTTATVTNSINAFLTIALKPGGTVLGNGTDPGNAALAPGGPATMADAFTFQTGVGTDTITDVTVGLGTGSAAGLSLVEITDDAGTTVYGSVTNPASDTPTITLSTNTLTATTTLTQYKIRVTPRSHAAMPAPPGATYTVTAKVNSWTGTNTRSGSDSAGATVTIDNQSPGDVTGASGTAGDSQVTLNWTNPADADLNSIVVLRDTVAVAGTPVEGTTYTVGNTIGTSVVRCVVTPPTAGCTDTGLTNGTAYHYKIFTRDTNGNYSVGAVPAGSPFTPFGPACYAVASAAWNLTSTWASASGGTPGTCPGAGNIPDSSTPVFIGETSTAYNVTIPAGYAAQAANVTLGSSTNNSKSLTLSAATSSLAVGGDLVIYNPTNNNNTNALNINAGTVTVGSDVTLNGTSAANSRVARINITTGTLTVGGGLTYNAGDRRRAVIDMSGGAGTLNLAGALTVNTRGTLDPGTSSTFNFNGASVAQTIPIGVSDILYNNLHVNNTSSGGATLSNNDITTARVAGDLRILSGTLNDGGFTIDGNAGRTFEVANGATFIYTTNTWVAGFTRTFGATSTVNYSRAGNQDVASEDYGHLTLSNSGTKTLPGGTLNIAGNLAMSGTADLDNNGGTVNMNGSAAQAITLNSINSNLNNLIIANTAATVSAGSNIVMDGNFTVNASGTFSAGSFLHSLVGNFTNNGTFTAGTSTFTFNGAAAQSLTSAAPISFYKLTMNNTSTGLTIGSDVTVTNTLSFTSGVINTPAPPGDPTGVIIASGAIVSRTGTGHVAGNLTRNVAAGSDIAVIYDVGDAGAAATALYTPFTATFDTVTIAGNVRGYTTISASSHPNIATSDINSSSDVNRYWSLYRAATGPSGLTTFGATVNFIDANPVDVDAAAVIPDFIMQRYDGTAWASLDVTAASSTGGVGTVSGSGGDVSADTSSNARIADIAIGNDKNPAFNREVQFIYTSERP